MLANIPRLVTAYYAERPDPSIPGQPHGGPADTHVTAWIEERASAAPRRGPARRRAHPLRASAEASTTHRYDYLGSYVDEPGAVVEMDAIRDAGLRVGVDPLGGAGVRY